MPSYSSPPNQQTYYEQVWTLVRQIPYGHVATYGQIGKMIPPPNGVEIEAYTAFAPRWVGGAMANCPDDVPWQRVINSQGKISERPGGAERQRLLLEDEGVVFVKDKIDLKKFGWSGSSGEENIQQTKMF
ncbi:MAG: MGMT family protein [Anaerolineales bacterium]|nr:MGMT family protein [Anaerolineales bacterium]